MKVNGQLEVAQLECLSADPSLLPRARVWFNTATGLVKVYDGSTIQSFQFQSGVTPGFFDNGITGAGTKAIDWSKGTIQKVRQTGPCAFTFANGVDGVEYTLLVENNVTNPFPYVFNLGAQDALSNPIVPPCMNYGEVRIHKFVYRTSFSGAVTTTIAADAARGTGSWLTCDLYQPPGDQPILAAGQTGTSGQLCLYPFRRFTGRTEWYQSNNLNVTTAASVAYKFSPSYQWIAVANATSPFINIYATNTITGVPSAVPTKYTDPVTLPAGAATSTDWHPNERNIAVSHTTTPFVSIYPWSSNGFGTKWANPTTLPAGNGLCVAWNPLGDFIAVTHSTTPFISVYPFDQITGIGAKLTDASVLPTTQSTGSPRSVAWSPGGDWIIMGTGTTPFVWSCPFNRSTGSFGTPQALPLVNIQAGEVRSVAFSRDGAYVFIGGTGSANIFPFDNVNGVAWGTPLTTAFAAQTYIDAVWSNFEPRVFTVTTTSSTSPVSQALGYYAKPWIRSLDG